MKAFFEKPEIAEAVISPTGRYVALVAGGQDGQGQLFLAVLDTQSMSLKPLTKLRYADVAAPRWVNDKRIVFGATDTERIGGRPEGVFAIDVDGTAFKTIADVAQRWRYFFATTAKKDSDSIFVLEPHKNFRKVTVDLVKVDTRTGADQKFDRPDENVVAWTIDDNDEPRFATVSDAKGKGAMLYRNPATNNWEKLSNIDLTTGIGAFKPIGRADDENFYAVAGLRGGTDALRTFNIRTKTLSSEALLSAKGFDISPTLIRSSKGVLGARFTSDAETTVWYDADIKEIQARIDKALPGTINRVDPPIRAETPFVLVKSFSDAEPGHYFLFDKEKDKLLDIGRMRPDIDPKRMAQRDFVRYKARDGLEIPAWITVPKDAGKGPRPMVVLVHGGPWLRGGRWEWDAESQFLASRGYTVLEPEFRGSRGYGFAHFKAGWKQWGLAMQDDIADGARWAIEKGYADPKRICIAGASYGGYATLMGLANDPDLFRCGFEWVGVTDLELLFSGRWSTLSDDWKMYGIALLIGDPDADAERFKATSPVAQAARIKRPVLMAYGHRDPIVPFLHGERMRLALYNTNNADVEWAAYAQEGHGWGKLEDSIDWWTRVEKFLARNIGQ